MGRPEALVGCALLPVECLVLILFKPDAVKQHQAINMHAARVQRGRTHGKIRCGLFPRVIATVFNHAGCCPQKVRIGRFIRRQIFNGFLQRLPFTITGEAKADIFRRQEVRPCTGRVAPMIRVGNIAADTQPLCPGKGFNFIGQEWDQAADVITGQVDLFAFGLGRHLGKQFVECRGFPATAFSRRGI